MVSEHTSPGILYSFFVDDLGLLGWLFVEIDVTEGIMSVDYYTCAIKWLDFYDSVLLRKEVFG